MIAAEWNDDMNLILTLRPFMFIILSNKHRQLNANNFLSRFAIKKQSMLVFRCRFFALENIAVPMGVIRLRSIVL